MRSEWNFVPSKGIKALGCLSSWVVFQMTRVLASFERACYNPESAWGGISGCVYLTDAQVRLTQSAAGAGLCCPRSWLQQGNCSPSPGCWSISDGGSYVSCSLGVTFKWWKVSLPKTNYFPRGMCACSVRPCGLQPTRLLSPWDSPGKNIGVGSHTLLQGIFLTQGSNPCLLSLLHWQEYSLPVSHLGSLPKGNVSELHSSRSRDQPLASR